MALFVGIFAGEVAMVGVGVALSRYSYGLCRAFDTILE